MHVSISKNKNLNVREFLFTVYNAAALHCKKRLAVFPSPENR